MTLAFKKIWDKELKLNGYPNKFAGTFNISYEELKKDLKKIMIKEKPRSL